MESTFSLEAIIFRIITEFKADNEIDKATIVNKTTKIYKENPACNGYYLKPELNDVLKKGDCCSNLDYDKVDWFVNGVLKLENKLVFHFKNTNKDITMTQKDDEQYRNKNVCQFCEREIIYDKARDQCQLTGSYRDPAHSKCDTNVTQKQSNFL